MSVDPRDSGWDRQLEEGLPDCRLRALEREGAVFWYGREAWQVVFCANCGEPRGAVPPSCPHVFYVCEECFARLGAPPGAAEVK